MRRSFGIALFLVFALVAAACGGDDSGDGGSGSCDVGELNLVTPGTLTVGTGEPVFPPWMGVGDDFFDVPESKTGFEGALVYALAAELGFTDDQVVFTRTGFTEVIAPGPKSFDFNIQQYSITDDREEVVDFSDPYYTPRQALVTFEDSPYANVSSVNDLKDAKLVDVSMARVKMSNTIGADGNPIDNTSVRQPAPAATASWWQFWRKS